MVRGKCEPRRRRSGEASGEMVRGKCEPRRRRSGEASSDMVREVRAAGRAAALNGRPPGRASLALARDAWWGVGGGHLGPPHSMTQELPREVAAVERSEGRERETVL